ADLQGFHIAEMDMNTLDILQVTETRERECLLSAIYQDLHPTDTVSQSLDKLLTSIGSHDIETLTAALAKINSQSFAPHDEHSVCEHVPHQD
ncbi:hypothetical protein NDU88_009366, partial [Pleurodeles waltl]